MGNRIHVQELAQNLAKCGHEVVLFSQLTGWPYQGGVVLRSVRGTMSLSRLRVTATLGYTFLLTLFGRIPRPDIIYTRGAPLATGFVLAKLLRRPLIVEVNGLRRDETESSLGKRLPLRVRRDLWLYEKEIAWANHVIAVTPGIRNALVSELRISPEKTTVVPNGANTELFRPIDKRLVCGELGLPDEQSYVCFVGHLVAWQGTEHLVRSIPLILGECPQVRFIIVGDGPMKRKLLALAEQVGVSDRTIFTGTVPYEKVPLYINASDVCVAPFIRARNERIGLSPLKLYDYLACGKPVVGSDIVGVADTLQAANAGIAVRPEDPGDLAGAIIRLLGNDELRTRMGESGRKYVVENHSWRSVAEKVAQVCEHVATASRR
jgi:glycosyltransferase involved in cell wall biosynthesis